MSRIAPLDPPYPSEIQTHFDQIMPPGAPPLVLFRTVATSERAWRKFRAGSLLDRGPLSLRQREIVIDRVCARTGCEYEWGVHVAAFAGAARLTDAEVAATVLASADAGGWSPAERALVAAVDALDARARLSDAEYGALATHFDDDQILEIILLAGFYRTVSYLCGALDLPLEPGAARFPSAPSAKVDPGLAIGTRSTF
jgi:alkylhydroperoxidase family enzyme